MKDKSDEDLMALIQFGKEEAFSELYKRYRTKLLRFLYRLLNNEDKAKDFLQDLFIRIIEKPEKFNTSHNFSSWVYTVASNMCKNEFRNNQNRQSILEDIGYNQDHILLSSYDTIDKKYFDKEFNKIFDQLNNEQQLLITLRFQQELTVKEIAEIMSIAEGTIKSRLFYLLKNLSEKLKEFNPIL